MSSSRRSGPLAQPYMVGEGGLAREVMTAHGLTADLAGPRHRLRARARGPVGGLFRGKLRHGHGLVVGNDHVRRPEGRLSALSRHRGTSSGTYRSTARRSPSGSRRFRTRVLRARDCVAGRSAWSGCRMSSSPGGRRSSTRISPPSAGRTLTLQDVAPGRYRIEFWNTHTGEIEAVCESSFPGGALPLALPAIATDLALKVVRLGHANG